ncbi:hypothetical protein H2200_006484 [Cladophialophora chaetospira]|uniref:Uncharacterized protein n=1 Tax=Cladophialophora chaetospira TaxID=386627 RepID=A0AA39CHR9_9EURO|nr:hypothetical protein H2200_006484 [Cladophialophora chaetospira]
MAYLSSAEAEEEISRLQEKNERLTDDLFTLLQQPQDQATDASIREEFGDLCHSIDFWVDNIIEDSGLDSHNRKLGRKERSLLKEVGINGFAPRDEHAGAYLLLSVAVQREIQRRIFDRPYPVGITKQQEAVLEQVLQGMRTLDSGREQVIRDRWRSEAVRALTVHKDFDRSRDSALKGIVDAAMDFLSPRSDNAICGLSHRAFQRHRDTLYNDIFAAALRLHQSLRSSIHQYRVQPPDIDGKMTGEEMAERRWRFKDVDRWQDLKTTDRSARPICSLFPSIVRISDGSGDYLTIVPPVVIVELQSSKASGQSSRVQSSRPSPAHSLTTETMNREMERHGDRTRRSDHTHADPVRSRDMSRSTDLSSASNVPSGNGLLNRAVNWVSGRSETFPATKQKSPGRGELPRVLSSSGDHITQYAITEEGGNVGIHLPRQQTSPERNQRERRGSQHYNDDPRRRRTS